MEQPDAKHFLSAASLSKSFELFLSTTFLIIIVFNSSFQQAFSHPFSAAVHWFCEGSYYFLWQGDDQSSREILYFHTKKCFCKLGQRRFRDVRVRDHGFFVGPLSNLFILPRHSGIFLAINFLVQWILNSGKNGERQ